MAVWYTVDQKVAGVIVLSFLVTIFRTHICREVKVNNHRLIFLASRPTTGRSLINRADARSRLS